MQVQWNRNISHIGKAPFNILNNMNVIDLSGVPNEDIVQNHLT